VRDGVGFSAGLRLAVRLRVRVRETTDGDGPGEELHRAVPGTQDAEDDGGLGTTELVDGVGVGVGVGVGEDELGGALVVDAALDELLLGALVVGVADFVAASGEVIC
jgi:hypothetical protein